MERTPPSPSLSQRFKPALSRLRFQEIPVVVDCGRFGKMTLYFKGWGKTQVVRDLCSQLKSNIWKLHATRVQIKAIYDLSDLSGPPIDPSTSIKSLNALKTAEAISLSAEMEEVGFGSPSISSRNASNTALPVRVLKASASSLAAASKENPRSVSLDSFRSISSRSVNNVRDSRTPKHYHKAYKASALDSLHEVLEDLALFGDFMTHLQQAGRPELVTYLWLAIELEHYEETAQQLGAAMPDSDDSLHNKVYLLEAIRKTYVEGEGSDSVQAAVRDAFHPFHVADIAAMPANDALALIRRTRQDLLDLVLGALREQLNLFRNRVAEEDRERKHQSFSPRRLLGRLSPRTGMPTLIIEHEGVLSVLEESLIVDSSKYCVLSELLDAVLVLGTRPPPMKDEEVLGAPPDSLQERLRYCLSDLAARGLFLQYLQAHHAEESLLFWLDVEVYERDIAKDASTASANGNIIWNKFLRIGASRELNLSAEIREPLRQAMENDTWDAHTFERARQEVEAMLARHSVLSFFQSAPFKRRLFDSERIRRFRESGTATNDMSSRLMSLQALSERDLITQPPQTLHARLNYCLGNTAVRDLFREFVRQAHCEEVLQLWEAIQLFTELDTEKERRATAAMIWNTYLASGSVADVGLSPTVLKSVKQALESSKVPMEGGDEHAATSAPLPADIFKDAMMEAEQRLARDAMLSFFNSSSFRERLANSERVRHLRHVISSEPTSPANANSPVSDHHRIEGGDDDGNVEGSEEGDEVAGAPDNNTRNLLRGNSNVLEEEQPLQQQEDETGGAAVDATDVVGDSRKRSCDSERRSGRKKLSLSAGALPNVTSLVDTTKYDLKDEQKHVFLDLKHYLQGYLWGDIELEPVTELRRDVAFNDVMFAQLAEHLNKMYNVKFNGVQIGAAVTVLDVVDMVLAAKDAAAQRSFPGLKERLAHSPRLSRLVRSASHSHSLTIKQASGGDERGASSLNSSSEGIVIETVSSGGNRSGPLGKALTRMRKDRRSRRLSRNARGTRNFGTFKANMAVFMSTSERRVTEALLRTLEAHQKTSSFCTELIRREFKRCKEAGKPLGSLQDSETVMSKFLSITFFAIATRFLKKVVAAPIQMLKANTRLTSHWGREKTSAEVHRNVRNLVMVADLYMENLARSAPDFPLSLRLILTVLREQVIQQNPANKDSYICDVVFRRWLGPALSLPEMYAITTDTATEGETQVLLKISVLVQQAALGTKFPVRPGGKDVTLELYNAFIERRHKTIRSIVMYWVNPVDLTQSLHRQAKQMVRRAKKIRRNPTFVDHLVVINYYLDRHKEYILERISEEEAAQVPWDDITDDLWAMEDLPRRATPKLKPRTQSVPDTMSLP